MRIRLCFSFRKMTSSVSSCACQNFHQQQNLMPHQMSLPSHNMDDADFVDSTPTEAFKSPSALTPVAQRTTATYSAFRKSIQSTNLTLNPPNRNLFGENGEAMLPACPLALPVEHQGTETSSNQEVPIVLTPLVPMESAPQVDATNKENGS